MIARLVFAASLLCFAATVAWADPPARVARLAWLEGEVSLRPAGDGAPCAAQRNWPLTSGDRLVTGERGRAEVWIGSTALRLDAGTELELARLDDRELVLRLARGSLALRAASAEVARTTRVDTPLGAYTPLQPGEWRFDVEPAAGTATAWRGAAQFRGDGAALTLQPGQRALVLRAAGGSRDGAPAGAAHENTGAPDSPARGISGAPGKAADRTAVGIALGAPVDDAFAAFVRARDEAFDGRTAERYVSPEMTGIEDLDSHGRWQSTADYGAVWLPDVPDGWAPYRDGRWAWIAPWGWTWIDAAPWGYAPSHYGRWALWQGRWAWVPGNYVAQPVYAPALVGWQQDAAGRRRWFPLAPREPYLPPYPASDDYLRALNQPQLPHAALPAGAPTRYRYQDEPRAVNSTPQPSRGNST